MASLLEKLRRRWFDFEGRCRVLIHVIRGRPLIYGLNMENSGDPCFFELAYDVDDYVRVNTERNPHLMVSFCKGGLVAHRKGSES